MDMAGVRPFQRHLVLPERVDRVAEAGHQRAVVRRADAHRQPGAILWRNLYQRGVDVILFQPLQRDFAVMIPAEFSEKARRRAEAGGYARAYRRRAAKALSIVLAHDFHSEKRRALKTGKHQIHIQFACAQ